MTTNYSAVIMFFVIAGAVVLITTRGQLSRFLALLGLG